MSPPWPLFPSTEAGHRIALRLIRWVGGLSLSSVVLLLIAFLTTIILRRKGYGVRLGLACLIFYAHPGARRFPDGCQVRVSTRIVGFLFGGCRGPWLDVYAARFYMRLRPTVVPSPSGNTVLPGGLNRLLRFLRLYVYSVGIAAVDHGYWSTLFRNILTRIVAFIVRGLRVRVEKVRMWKDGGSWEYKAEQFVLAGHAAGVFGSRYSLSVNEMYVNVCMAPLQEPSLQAPINASLILRRGVHISAFLTPRFFTLFRPRRMAIMDDLKVSVNICEISCVAPSVLDASLTKLCIELCPGYSRGLRAKLPPSAPATKHPRKPGILRYWEGTGSIAGLAVRFSAPVLTRDAVDSRAPGMSLPASVADTFKGKVDGLGQSLGEKNGVFLRAGSVKVDAYGKAADERHEAMKRATITVRGCSAGSTTVDALSHALYESMSSTNSDERSKWRSDVPENTDCVESVENIDKIVAARPEALLWVEDVTAGVDVNCSKRRSTRVDIAGNGGILAIEPIGLLKLVQDLRSFASKYTVRSPRKAYSTSSSETDSVASLARSSSGNSLQGSEKDALVLRFVCDFRYLTAMVLGHGPVGDGDTMAIVMSTRTIVIPQIDVVSGSFLRAAGSVTDASLMHWSQWARTTNLSCQEATFDILQGAADVRRMAFKHLTVDWDLDVQSGLEGLPGMLSCVKQLDGSGWHGAIYEVGGPAIPQLPPCDELERTPLTNAECKERHERKHKKLMNRLGKWEVQGKDVSVTAVFPDGPRLGVRVGELPTIKLNTESFVGRNLVLTMQDRKCAYAAELRMASPLHTMNGIVAKRRIEIEIQSFRFMMWHDFQFGFLLQDWLLRVRSAVRISRRARLQRRGIPFQEKRRKPLPDIHFTSSDVEVYFEDHPIGGFLTRMLPLYQDETSECLVREQLMDVRIKQLERIARAEIAGTAQRCMDALRKKDSEIWVERVKKLKQASPPKKVANGYLPDLKFAPVATFVAAGLSFSVIMDDLVREQGSAESIRRLKMLDDYELGSKKYNKTRQHDRDVWNSIGFRDVEFEATGVRLRFRDYNDAFVVIDRMYLDKTIMGQAVQATLPPYIAETTVAIGRRRLAKVVKGLGPTKTYADVHLVMETLQCGFNPSFLGAIGDFSKGINRFFAGGKNPSPRIPWFDSLRVNMHGRMRITAEKLKGHLTSSISPYSMTKHFVEVEVDNFEMLTSRLEATREDPFPISWKLHNWRIRPSNFDMNLKSEVVFDFVRVGLSPAITVLSGDPQDHYFVPFPSKEEVEDGGPGIGRGSTTLIYVKDPVQEKDNGFGNFTDWTTGLHDLPGFDSFKDFKTHRIILGIDVCVRHAECPRTPTRQLRRKSSERANVADVSVPYGASVLHSDAISTLIKVIKKLIRRPISCRLAPRWVSKARKPPGKTGLSSTLVGLDLFVDARNLNVMLYNNLEPGHGLFISISSLVAELWKRTDIQRIEGGGLKKTSRLTRRRFNIIDIYSSIRVPGLDMAVDSNDTGKLFTVDKVALSDDLRDELSYIASPCRKGVGMQPVSGFGCDDVDESPFYTFSATHPLQRGKTLDKVLYDKRLLVDRVRLIWSPVRRTSVFAWPDAFKEKSFCMKAPKVDLSESTNAQNCQHRNASNSRCLKLNSMQQGLADSTSQVATTELLGDDDEDQMSDLDLTEGHQYQSDRRIGSTFGTDGSHATTAGTSLRQSKEPRSNADIPSTIASGDRPTSGTHQDPLSPPLMSLSRSRATAARRPAGDMMDLLPQYQEKPSHPKGQQGFSGDGKSSRDIEVLKTTPKFVVYINDCQVAFGSPETSGIVILTSNAVRAGIVDKMVQKNMQLGEANERWADREYRVHLNSANLYTRSKAHGDFDFSAKNWVPDDGRSITTLSLVTRNPISMDLMYISSSSTPREDAEEQEDDHIMRPSLLFINIPDIGMSTNADEFHAAVDVVRRVLMQSMRSAEVVNEELTNLRYKLQLAGGKVSSDELDDFMRQLNNVTKQFLYAGETFQQRLVEALMLPQEESFADTLLRYKAKAKAVATFMRQDQRASSTDVLYPTMYVSYSFDKLSWELREKSRELNKEVEHPFVEISLDDLVCRHIFYVGRGSSAEMTFGNIGAQNKITSTYFNRILQPATTGAKLGPSGAKQNKSRIKASDGSAVAFRWYSTQEDRVGGIPVYDLLTIQVAPMTAKVTRKLYSSVSGFIFSARSKPDQEEAPPGNVKTCTQNAGRHSGRSGVPPASPNVSTDSKNNSGGESASVRRKASSTQALGSLASKMDDVSQMARRGESSMLFKYIFIDAFELTASYKNKENSVRGVLDFFDLFVTTPSFSYSSQVWTWKDFSSQIRKDLVMTFARRGVSNLAKIKLLPGYSRARRKLAQGADTVIGTICNHLPSAATMTEDASGTKKEEVEFGDVVGNESVRGVHAAENCSTEAEEDRAANNAPAADKSATERRRETVLKYLYGASGSEGRSSKQGVGRSRSAWESDTSGESIDYTMGMNTRAIKPPIPPARGGTAPTPSGGNVDEDHAAVQAPRASLFERIRKRAHELKHDVKSGLEEPRM